MQKKNLRKGKCLTYLCSVNRERHKPYTKGIAGVYEWRQAPSVIGRLRLLDALRAIGRHGVPIGERNSIADKGLNRLRGATMTTGGTQSNWKIGDEARINRILFGIIDKQKKRKKIGAQSK